MDAPFSRTGGRDAVAYMRVPWEGNDVTVQAQMGNSEQSKARYVRLLRPGLAERRKKLGRCEVK